MANEIQELKFQVGEVWKGVYSSSTAYGLANVVQDPTGLSVYRSLKSGNVGHPLSDASWWFRIIDLSSIKAESDRIAALNQTIAQDEALRNAAEELRQQHEAERVAAEIQRNEAEQQRISAEQARVNAESARATAEQQRITAEQGRVSAESARVQAEQARALAETLRANAEDQRAANEQNRIAAEQQRIERAEQDHQRAESDHATYVDSLGAFDISSYHATDGVLAKYADLTAALGTGGANIPDDLRKGGMSVKFVQSSDNKYVQARLMANTFTTDVTQWQGVDEEPTAGSENLVKSGGVAENIGMLITSGVAENVTDVVNVVNYTLPGAIQQGTRLRFICNEIGSVISKIQFIFATGSYYELYELTEQNSVVTVPIDCTKIRAYIASASWILQSGGTVSASIYFKENSVYFATKQKLDDVSIVDNLTTGGSENVLSAEQGKALKNAVSPLEVNDKVLTFTTTSTNQQITALGNLSVGSRIYRFASDDVDTTFRYYYTKNGTDSYKNINNGDSLVIGAEGETLRYFAVVQRGKTIHVVVNQTDYDTPNNPLLYDSISIKNLVGHNKVFSVSDLAVSTDASTNIYQYGSIAKIPKGRVVHIDFADSFSSWLSEYRLYINQSRTYTAVKVQRYTFVPDTDVTSIRVSIANGKIISGQTPPNITVEMWWEDIAIEYEEIKAKTTPLLNLSKQSFIDANSSGYDSTNDKFTEGEYIVELAPASNTVALMDVISNYVAKYTSTGESYPYLQMRYHFGSWDNWWKYPIGGNGYYKANQCKLVCPGTDKLSSPWTTNIQIRIVVPDGCELYINNINAEYSNSLINKDAFKVFQHGTERRTTGADNKTNWDLWTHIGNYGAIVIPKRTTDGKWVCYHDDSFGSNPNVQIIGDPTAALPAASMQACTFAETQTLEYKVTNFYGDHDTIPLLSEFFAKCAQMGVHPALSCHPTHVSESESSTWKYADWAEVKALARKYRVLDKLTIKSSYNAEAAANFYTIFGNDIESYIADVSTEPTQATIEELAGIGWDLNKVKVGFELLVVSSYFSDATIALIEANNLVHGMAPGSGSTLYKDAKFLKDAIDKGCYEITADQFYSNGLNWA